MKYRIYAIQLSVLSTGIKRCSKFMVLVTIIQLLIIGSLL